MPPVRPCILPVTRSRNPLKLSFADNVLVVRFRGLRLTEFIASFSSYDSSARTLGPPSFLSSRICCREPAACNSALPAGGCGCRFLIGIDGRSVASRRSFWYGFRFWSMLSVGFELVIGETSSFSSAFCAPRRVRSYRADTSPPVQTVPSVRSQKVKNGCEKFVLMPQL